MIVIATLAVAAGWAIGRHDSGSVTRIEESTSSGRELSADAARVVALSLGTPNAMVDRPRKECEEPTQEALETAVGTGTEDLITAFISGTDNERLAALTKSLQYDIELQPELLINAYTNDASDEVRLLAFTTYIDSVSNDVSAVRAALQTATSNTSPIVQAEAYRLHEELTRYEAAIAASAPQGIP